MSALPPSHGDRIDMSARASELKEKLIGLKRSRDQTNATTTNENSNSNDNAAAIPSGPRSMPVKPAPSKLTSSQPRQMASQLGQTSSLAPQTPLQPRQSASVPPKKLQQSVVNPPASEEGKVRGNAKDADLEDWLAMTGYHDKLTRTRKLELFRRTKALAAKKESLEAESQKIEAEKARIEAERRKLMEENGIHYTPTNPAKRFMVEDKYEPKNRPHKAPRIERTPPPEPRRGNYREPRQGFHPMDHYGRDYSPPHHPRMSPPPRHHRMSSPPRHQRMSSPPFRRHDYPPHRAPPPLSSDRERSEELSPRDRRYVKTPQKPPQGLQPPRRVDLGDKGDTRFFIVKSFNTQNVDWCMGDGLWATNIPNAEILTKAFAECKNVILFFSINGSGSFQGYARMQTAPSPQTLRPRWYSGIHWRPSDPFKIEWLSRTPVPFCRIHHLNNPLNDGRSIIIGRDGQEIDEENGRKLLKAMQDYGEAAAGIPGAPGPGTRDDSADKAIIKLEPGEMDDGTGRTGTP